jgi:hypothetical protein
MCFFTVYGIDANRNSPESKFISDSGFDGFSIERSCTKLSLTFLLERLYRKLLDRAIENEYDACHLILLLLLTNIVVIRHCNKKAQALASP